MSKHEAIRRDAVFGIVRVLRDRAYLHRDHAFIVRH
jgi:hypothetical protein